MTRPEKAPNKGVVREMNLQLCSSRCLMECLNVYYVNLSDRRPDRKITFREITGSICLKGVSKEMLKYLLAGELLHIGKNSSFGFGRYTVE